MVQGHPIEVSVSGIKKYCSVRPGHMPLWLGGPDAIYVPCVGLRRLSAVTLLLIVGFLVFRFVRLVFLFLKRQIRNKSSFGVLLRFAFDGDIRLCYLPIITEANAFLLVPFFFCPAG